MDSPYTVDQVISALAPPKYIDDLPRPHYSGWMNGKVSKDWPIEKAFKIGLAVHSMKDHTTNEGYQIFQGLEENGWYLQGHGFHSGHLEEGDKTYVPSMIDWFIPSTILMQDEREWDVSVRDFRDPKAKFTGVEELAKHPEIFKLTILKDAHQRPNYHRASAEKIGCHGWVVYYHPRIVKHLAPYVRVEDMVRTYHTIDPLQLPMGWLKTLLACGMKTPHQVTTKLNIDPKFLEEINPKQIYEIWKEIEGRCITLHQAATLLFSPEDNRRGVLLSGAVSDAYPLRKRLFADYRRLPQCQLMKHPGYHRSGCCTPKYLDTLCKYKVAICTCSRYGYALRKIIEATACGCRVLTDLPVDEVLPEIDGNLVRIRPDCHTNEIREILKGMIDTYDHCLQIRWAIKAMQRYDYAYETKLLSDKVEQLRINYN